MESSTSTSAFSSSGFAESTRLLRTTFQSARGGNFGGNVESVWLTRRKDQQRVAPLPLHDVIGRDHSFFFLGDYASGHKHGPALLGANLTLQPRAEFACGRRLGVVFQVACHLDALFGRTHFAQPRGVLGRLREKDFCVLQSALEKLADKELPALEPGERFFRYTRVCKDHGNVLAPRFAQEIRPDLRLHHDHQRGPDGSQGTANRHDPIERKIENAIHGLQSFAREALTRLRGRRDENRAPGKRRCKPSASGFAASTSPTDTA